MIYVYSDFLFLLESGNLCPSRNFSILSKLSNLFLYSCSHDYFTTLFISVNSDVRFLFPFLILVIQFFFFVSYLKACQLWSFCQWWSFNNQCLISLFFLGCFSVLYFIISAVVLSFLSFFLIKVSLLFFL